MNKKIKVTLATYGGEDFEIIKLVGAIEVTGRKIGDILGFKEATLLVRRYHVTVVPGREKSYE